MCRLDSNCKLTSECSLGTDAANEQLDDVCKDAQAYIRQMEALQAAKMTALRNMESKLGLRFFFVPCFDTSPCILRKNVRTRATLLCAYIHV